MKALISAIVVLCVLLSPTAASAHSATINTYNWNGHVPYTNPGSSVVCLFLDHTLIATTGNGNPNTGSLTATSKGATDGGPLCADTDYALDIGWLSVYHNVQIWDGTQWQWWEGMQVTYADGNPDHDVHGTQTWLDLPHATFRLLTTVCFINKDNGGGLSCGGHQSPAINT